MKLHESSSCARFMRTDKRMLPKRSSDSRGVLSCALNRPSVNRLCDTIHLSVVLQKKNQKKNAVVGT